MPSPPLDGITWPSCIHVYKIRQRRGIDGALKTVTLCLDQADGVTTPSREPDASGILLQ